RARARGPRGPLRDARRRRDPGLEMAPLDGRAREPPPRPDLPLPRDAGRPHAAALRADRRGGAGAEREVTGSMPTTFSWTDEVRAAHAELSPFQASWLDFVAQRPEALAPEAFDLDRYCEIQPEKIQPWPLFAGAESLRSIAEGVRDVMRLVGTIPLRIFGGEPDRIADFYGCTVDLARRVMTLIEGGCLPHLVARGDFLGGPQSFACCEMNVAGNLGGWQVGHWAERIAASPLVAEFVARERLRVSGTHPIRALFEHAAAVGVARGLAAEGELTLALVTRGRVLHLLVKDAARLRSQSLESAGVGAGRFLICDEGELTEERGRTFLRGLRVHLFVDWGEEMKE